MTGVPGIPTIGNPRGAFGEAATSTGLVLDPSTQLDVHSYIRTLNQRTGIHIPSDWGKFWIPAREAAKAGTYLCRLAFIGDSITQGIHTSSPLTKVYPGLIRIALQDQYGDGGSGFYATTRNIVFSPGSAVFTTPDEYAAVSAGWVKGTLANGPAGYGIQAANAYGSDQTLTFGVRGNTISVFNIVNGTHGTYSWAVDGVTQGTHSCAGSADLATHTATGFGSGHHTVTITVAAGQNLLYICGVDAYNTTGMVIDNFGHGGATTSDFAMATATWGFAQDWSGGIQHPCDCLVYSLIVNDIAGAVTADTSFNNIATTLRAVKSLSGGKNGATDIIVVLNHIGNYEIASRNIGMAQFAAKVRGLCDHFGAALVNMNAVIGNNYAMGTALQYWGTTVIDDQGLPGTDPVHPGNIGNGIIRDQLLPILQIAA